MFTNITMEEESIEDLHFLSWLPCFEYKEDDTFEFGEVCMEYLRSVEEDTPLRQTVFSHEPNQNICTSPAKHTKGSHHDLELGLLLARSRTLSSVETERVQVLMSERLLTLTNDPIPQSKYGLLWQLNSKLKQRKTVTASVGRWGGWKKKRKKNSDWILRYFEINEGQLSAFDTKTDSGALWSAMLNQYTLETGISTKGRADCFLLRLFGSNDGSPVEICLGCNNIKERLSWIKKFRQSCRPAVTEAIGNQSFYLFLSVFICCCFL
jgi:hypothetical protein